MESFADGERLFAPLYIPSHFAIFIEEEEQESLLF
jgi:hypothetical protein